MSEKTEETKSAEISSISQLLRKSPQTGDHLRISSPIADNGDGSYSFTASNENETWKHTIRTEEV